MNVHYWSQMGSAASLNSPVWKTTCERAAVNLNPCAALWVVLTKGSSLRWSQGAYSQREGFPRRVKDLLGWYQLRIRTATPKILWLEGSRFIMHHLKWKSNVCKSNKGTCTYTCTRTSSASLKQASTSLVSRVPFPRGLRQILTSCLTRAEISIWAVAVRKPSFIISHCWRRPVHEKVMSDIERDLNLISQ